MTITDVGQVDPFFATIKKIKGLKLSQSLLAWYLDSYEKHPWRNLFEQSGDPYVVWLSEVMLQQTQIKTVLPKYLEFLDRYPDIRALANADELELRRLVKGLGYYRRFAFLHRAAKTLLALYPDLSKGKWPKTYAEWLELPGVGDYIASAVTSIAFDQPNPVVDGNVERVLCRLYDIRLPSNLPILKKTYKALAFQLLVRENPGAFNQAIMELGQKVCSKSSPKCSICPVRPYCQSYKAKSTALAPEAKLKRASEDLALRLTILSDRGRIALYNRGSKARFLKGVNGFVTEILAEDLASCGVDGFAKHKLAPLRKVGSFRHTITHHKLTVQVYAGTKKAGGKLDLAWLPKADVAKSLESSLDQKAWHIYLSGETGISSQNLL